MVDHAEGIRNILSIGSGYDGGYSPKHRSINQVDAVNKFYVKQEDRLDIDSHWYSESFKITLQASSETNLKTLLNAILNIATERVNGYIPSSTYSYLVKQANYDECFDIHIHAGSDPTFALPDSGLLGDTFAYSNTSKTTKAHIDIELNKPAGSELGIFQLPIILPSLVGSSVIFKLGLYPGGTGPPDVTDPAIIQAIDYDGGYDSVPDSGDYEEFSVLSEYTEITSITNDQYNEFTISDIVEEYYTKYQNSVISLLLGYGAIITDMNWYAFRKDSGDVNPDTKFPYMKATIDATATGYPFYITFAKGSTHKIKQIGPNKFECIIELQASYEVS